MCFVFIWEQTATCATYNINWLVFITEVKSVYSAVRTGSLNKAVCALSLKGWWNTKKTANSLLKYILLAVCFLPGNSPASEFHMPTFRNTLFYLHRRVGMKMEQSVPKPRHLKFRRGGITQKKKHKTFRTRQKFEIKNTFYLPILSI